MLARISAGPIPYDFAMDCASPQALFCSEVPYHAYRDQGLELWPWKSRISSPGLAAWLGGLGVRHFTTLVPSDLEYDPGLAPVAEWRSPEGLAQDRADGALLDALLEAAEEGARLGWPWWALLDPGGPGEGGRGPEGAGAGPLTPARKIGRPSPRFETRVGR